MAKSKDSPRLSGSEAEEFTQNLGQQAVATAKMIDFGMHVLGVPQSLEMDNDEWVQERLGGYVRRDRESLRDAVRELDSMTDDDGRPVSRTSQQIGEVIGLSGASVRRLRAEIEAEDARMLGPSTKGAETAESVTGPSAEPVTPIKLTAAERRMAVEDGMEDGRSDADMALDFGVSVGTIQKDRSAIERERKLADAKAEKEANMPPPAQQKASEAQMDTMREEVTRAVPTGISGYIEGAIERLEEIEDLSAQIADFEHTVERYVALGRALWEHGAVRGFDVSKIMNELHRWEES